MASKGLSPNEYIAELNKALGGMAWNVTDLRVVRWPPPDEQQPPGEVDDKPPYAILDDRPPGNDRPKAEFLAEAERIVAKKGFQLALTSGERGPHDPR